MIKKIKIETKPVTGKIDDSFIGIKIKNDTVNIFYPESYNFTDKNDDFKGFRDDFISIIRTISIAKTLTSDKAKIESSISNNGFALNSYLWIIKDYLANGFYVNREKVFKYNQRGRVNWKRTLNNQPIISNGNVIYKDTVVEVRNELDNLLIEIHKYCVKKSVDLIGWLFGLSLKHIPQKPFNDIIKKRYLITIRQELDKTFDDYKKLKLNHMIKVIQGLDGNANDNEFVYGVNSYYYIFERMIDSIFSNCDASEFNPSAKWYLKNNKVFNSSKLRPDTIFVKDKIAYILDAKYYRYGTTAKNEDLPETTSIKQNKLSEDIKEIHNAFILPYNKYNNDLALSNKLEYIGYAKTDYRKGEDSHEIVHAFLIDLKYVIDTWNKDNHIDEIIQLVNDIEDEQNRYKKTI